MKRLKERRIRRLMGRKVEKICPGTTKNYKRCVKRQTVRLERRQGKKLLDDAPKRRYRGWTT